MAPHCSTFAQKIPWTEEPGRLQSMSSLESDTTERLHFHFYLSCIGEGNGNPLQYSCLDNPRDRGAQWVAVYGVTELDTTEATQQQHMCVCVCVCVCVCIDVYCLLHLTVLCFADTAFLQIEDLWPPCIKQVYQHCFSSNICSLVSLSHVIFW